MAAKKRIGRPPKAKEDRKAVNFTFRSRGDMRERLRAAAAASGRSISEEIERRLDWSFREEDTATRVGEAAVRAIQSYHEKMMGELAKLSGRNEATTAGLLRLLGQDEKPEGPLLSDLVRLYPQKPSEKPADTPGEPSEKPAETPGESTKRKD
jgi:Arc-like DNA binding domain